MPSPHDSSQVLIGATLVFAAATDGPNRVSTHFRTSCASLTSSHVNTSRPPPATPLTAISEPYTNARVPATNALSATALAFRIAADSSGSNTRDLFASRDARTASKPSHTAPRVDGTL